MQSFLENPANLFLFLLADGLFDMVGPRSFTKSEDLSVPWCEPVWIEDSFLRCVQRIERHKRVRDNWYESALITLNNSTPELILASINVFPLVYRGHLLRVRGLYKPFLSFQRRIETFALSAKSL